MARWSPLLLAMLLAGCSSTPATPDAAHDPEDFSDLGLEADGKTGIIRGVVVDATIRPLQGAVVALDGQRQFVADAAGRFGFSHVEPGLHQLAVSHPGYAEVQQSVEVVAGVVDPPAVNLVLQALPGTEPRIVGLEWSGTIECSASVGGVFFSNCGAPAQVGLVDDSRRTTPIAGPPAFIQAELQWTATQRLGDELCMRHYAMEDGSLAGRLEPDVCGPSPQMQSMDAQFIGDEGIGNSTDIQAVVWVAERAEAPVGLALSQSFSVYTHIFYNMVPEPGWSFVVDGEHPLPE